MFHLKRSTQTLLLTANRNPMMYQHRVQAFATMQAMHKQQQQVQTLNWQRQNNNNASFNYMYLAAPLAMLLFMN